MIATLKNEESSVRSFLDALLAQTCHPQEIILVDGGSSDDTCRIIRNEYLSRNPSLVLIEELGNIAMGRNRAIREAHHDLIAVTDAGCRVSSDWLEKLAEPLLQGKPLDVCGGITLPVSQNLIQKAAGGYFTVPVEKEKTSLLLVSSRNIAFTRILWEKAGGYPEYLLLTGEDTLFNQKLLDAGARFLIVPEAVVYWPPPGTVEKIFLKAFHYSKGNAQGGFYQKTILKTAFAYLILLGFLAAGFWNPLLAAASLLGYGVLLFYSGLKLAANQKDGSLVFPGALVKGIIDLGNLAGYLTGLLKPQTGKQALKL